MRESLVAINVICNGKIINREGIPLLFYWNGETDVLEDIKSSIDFKQWLEDEEILTNMNNYLNSHVAFFYFKTHDEDYHDVVINMQNLFDFSKMENLNLTLFGESIMYLYKNAFPNNEIPSIPINNTLDFYKHRLQDVINKYNNTINVETILMSIRGYVQEYYPELLFDNVDNFMLFVRKNTIN